MTKTLLIISITTLFFTGCCSHNSSNGKGCGKPNNIFAPGQIKKL